MRFCFISDLHITDNDDALYKWLIEFYRRDAHDGDTIVLGGDIFDLFVGNKSYFTTTYHEFLSVVRNAGIRGVHTHYIEGNHDFRLERAYAGFPNLRVHPDEITFQLDGKRVYVAHGDRANPHDFSYHALRAFWRSKGIKWLIDHCPDKWVTSVGAVADRLSTGKAVNAPHEQTPDWVDRTKNLYRDYASKKFLEDYDVVVLGHCHIPDDFRSEVNGKQRQYANIGYPRSHQSYLEWDAASGRMVRMPIDLD